MFVLSLVLLQLVSSRQNKSNKGSQSQPKKYRGGDPKEDQEALKLIYNAIAAPLLDKYKKGEIKKNEAPVRDQKKIDAEMKKLQCDPPCGPTYLCAYAECVKRNDLGKDGYCDLTGCDGADKTCNKNTGKCETLMGMCMLTGCGYGFTCDEEYGLCADQYGFVQPFNNNYNLIKLGYKDSFGNLQIISSKYKKYTPVAKIDLSKPLPSKQRRRRRV